MKMVRNFATLAGVSLMLLTLGATGATAQGFGLNQFAGKFTLTHEAQWGGMTLPAGEYNLSYGQLFKGGVYAVMITGIAEGSPHGTILAGPVDQTSATKSQLVCIRNGDALIVRALELPALGETVEFPMPHGLRLLAQQMHRGTNRLLAEAPTLFQQIPVTLNQK